ncbi:TetR/AcrR family transcriptional regulator [Amphibacillus jilinensis]|uniref:TetR/AcrR family transcriptional regulator n=1 Tax=Amphibacillus jilinensis TaxID=1216008 RepID=UPI0002EB81AB|nr:TetR/AcrR family transcriptional regulator [Amphibacillus jilinensis]
MPPKRRYSKEKIIDTAFEIAKSEGIDNITIRKIAKKMGGSIAPIYVNFTDVTELKNEVINRVVALSQQMISEQNTGNPFYDIGLASMKMANEHSTLYMDLVTKQNSYMDTYNHDMWSILMEQMKKDPDLKKFDNEQLKTIFLKTQIFQTGLSIMVANDLLPKEFDEQQTIKLLEETGEDIIVAARLRQEGGL